MQDRQVPIGDIPPELFDNSTQLMTYDQLADMFQISLRTAKRWKVLGKIPHVKCGRQVRFLREDILERLQKKGA